MNILKKKLRKNQCNYEYVEKVMKKKKFMQIIYMLVHEKTEKFESGRRKEAGIN